MYYHFRGIRSIHCRVRWSRSNHLAVLLQRGNHIVAYALLIHPNHFIDIGTRRHAIRLDVGYDDRIANSAVCHVYDFTGTHWAARDDFRLDWYVGSMLYVSWPHMSWMNIRLLDVGGLARVNGLCIVGILSLCMVSLVSKHSASNCAHRSADESPLGRVIALMSNNTTDHRSRDTAQQGAVSGVVVLRKLRIC